MPNVVNPVIPPAQTQPKPQPPVDLSGGSAQPYIPQAPTFTAPTAPAQPPYIPMQIPGTYTGAGTTAPVAPPSFAAPQVLTDQQKADLAAVTDSLFKNGKVDLSALTPSQQQVLKALGGQYFVPGQQANANFSQMLSSGAVQRGTPGAAAAQTALQTGAEQSRNDLYTQTANNMTQTAAQVYANAMGISESDANRIVSTNAQALSWAQSQAQLDYNYNALQANYGLGAAQLNAALYQATLQHGIDLQQLQLDWNKYVTDAGLQNKNLDQQFSEFMQTLGFNKDQLAQDWLVHLDTQKNTQQQLDMQAQQQQFDQAMAQLQYKLQETAQSATLSMQQKEQNMTAIIQAINTMNSLWQNPQSQGAISQLLSGLGISVGPGMSPASSGAGGGITAMPAG